MTNPKVEKVYQAVYRWMLRQGYLFTKDDLSSLRPVARRIVRALEKPKKRK